jgi:hypothetical protein
VKAWLSSRTDAVMDFKPAPIGCDRFSSYCCRTSNFFAQFVYEYTFNRLFIELYNHEYLATMLRPAFFRALRMTATAPRFVRPAPVALRSSTPCSVRKNQFLPAVSCQAARCYSAPAGLSKNEVEGRIIDLLKNFDKVLATSSQRRRVVNLKPRSRMPLRFVPTS